jgi:MbtH protein
MVMEVDTEADAFQVIVNAEGQYSLWRQTTSIPNGWKSANKKGSRAECIEFVDTNWVDMCPMSLKNAIGACPEPVSRRVLATSGTHARTEER